MGSLKQLAKITGPKMIPFVNAVGMYFVLGGHKTQGEYWTTMLKCAPIMSLIIFILVYGNELPKRTTYAHNILLGLIFSCIGDALLNHGRFAYGMAIFGIAQIFYIIAFHSRTIKFWIAGILYAGGLLTVFVLRNKLESIMLIGLPIYTFLLLTMCWRSIARAADPKYSSDWLPKFCALGSVLFVISDTMIAFDRFHAPIAHSTILIMATYYAAQFAITLSIVNLPAVSQVNGEPVSAAKKTAVNMLSARPTKLE